MSGPLAFDFGNGVSGVIPRPSGKQAGRFTAALLTLRGRPEAGLLARDRQRWLAGVYAAVCSGTPSAEQILALPYRRRLAFYQWLDAELHGRRR